MSFHGGRRMHGFVVLLSCYEVVDVSGGVLGIRHEISRGSELLCEDAAGVEASSLKKHGSFHELSLTTAKYGFDQATFPPTANASEHDREPLTKH